MTPAKLALYVRTLRHLRPRQLLYLPLRRAQALAPRRVPEGREMDAGRAAMLAPVVTAWGPGDAEARLAEAHQVAEGTFRFLGHSEPAVGVSWTERRASHLWSYHLHYFGWALDLVWAARLTGESRFVDVLERHVADWLDAAGTGRGVGWEPYALSMRILNWSYAILLLEDRLDGALRSRMERSLHAQLRRLEATVEHHVQGNHLQKNLQALAVGGMLYECGRARRWREQAWPALWGELGDQVLPDGVHAERSPLYHLTALADFLETADLGRAVGLRMPAGAAERLGEMARCRMILSRDDGTPYLLNDSAGGHQPAAEHLGALESAVLGGSPRAHEGIFTLPHGGFYGEIDRNAGFRIIVDAGEPGPAHQPAHAHCGLLSYELDLGGRPVVVDSGVSGYADDPLRSYVRSTRAHNTVTVGGREQSETWGAFRMARRARLREAVPLTGSGGSFAFRGSCTPFHDRRTLHVREFERTAEGLRVRDRVEGSEGLERVSYLHLHPDFEVRVEGTVAVAIHGELRLSVRTVGVSEVRCVRGREEPAQGWYAPRFGVAVPAPVLEMTAAGASGEEFGYDLAMAEG